MATEEQRENRSRLLEDDIGRSLAQSQASGELKSAKSYGKALDLGDGYDETPADLRMPYKMLKDGGYFPPEVLLMREINDLQTALNNAGQDEGKSAPLRQQLAELRQRLAWALERLRR